MSGFQIRAYLLEPVKHPPARLRWEEARERCQDWHDRYEETRQMTNKIQAAEGPVMRGPDEPAVAEAMQREEAGRAVGATLVGASVGAVAPQQAGGILPFITSEKITSSRIAVDDEMIRRAQDAGAENGQLLEAGFIRAMLEAAFRV